jgi:hypothetical protein
MKYKFLIIILYFCLNIKNQILKIHDFYYFAQVVHS